jgi:hypothetical protein
MLWCLVMLWHAVRRLLWCSRLCSRTTGMNRTCVGANIHVTHDHNCVARRQFGALYYYQCVKPGGFVLTNSNFSFLSLATLQRCGCQPGHPRRALPADDALHLRAIRGREGRGLRAALPGGPVWHDQVQQGLRSVAGQKSVMRAPACKEFVQSSPFRILHCSFAVSYHLLDYHCFTTHCHTN